MANPNGFSDQDMADLKQIRSLLPAADPRRAKLDSVLGPEESVQAQTPQASPASQQHEPGMVSRFFDWANKPFGFVQPTLDRLESVEKGYITPGEQKQSAEHQKETGEYLKELHSENPHVSAVKQGVAGFTKDMLGMLATPTSAALAVAGALAGNPEAGALTRTNLAARAALEGTGAYFGAKGAGDVGAGIYEHVTGQAHEDLGEGVKRYLQDFAMMAAGAGGVKGLTELPQQLRDSNAARAQQQATAKAQAPSAAQAQARVNQVTGTPNAPKPTATIHVNPDLANEITEWSKNPALGKRLIVRKNTVQLAHIDEDTGRMTYTDTKAKRSYSDDGGQAVGQVPIQLWKENAGQATSVPGHFLSWKIGDQPAQATPAPVPMPATPDAMAQAVQTPTPQPAAATPQPTPSLAPEARIPSPAAAIGVQPEAPMPIAGPEMGLESTGRAEPLVPQPQPTPTAPRPISEPISPARERAASQGIPSPLPDAIAKSQPRYGYGSKNFDLDFEDPRDLAAYTMGQLKDNKAQRQFVDYLKGEYPDITSKDVLAHRDRVRATIKDMARTGNPDEGPLKVPSHGGIDVKPKVQETTVVPADTARGVQEVKLPTVQPEEAPKPAEPEGGVKPGTEVPAEAKPEAPPAPATKVSGAALDKEGPIRKLVGQVLRMSQLRQGEQLHHSIDKAIDAAKESNPVPDEAAAHVSKILGKDVKGKVLSNPDIAMLEKARGGQPSTEPKVKYWDADEFNRVSQDPRLGDDLLNNQMASLEYVHQRLSDPDLDPELRKKYEELASSEKYFTMEKGMDYPKPVDLPEDHPEAPFTKQAFGHRITPINIENLKSALGVASMRNIFSGTSAKDPYRFLSEEEKGRLKELEKPTMAENAEQAAQAKVSMQRLAGKATPAGMHYEEFTGVDKAANEEYRQMAQNALERRLGKTKQTLSTLAGDWNEARGQAQTPLTDQLSKLSPEVRAHLPKELFDYEKPAEAKTGTPTETPSAKQPEEAAAPTKTKSTPVRAGAQTATEGVKYTKWDQSLKKENPDAAKFLNVIHQAVGDGVKAVENRQKAYAQASKAYYDAVKANDPFALKKAIDTIVRPGEAGYVQFKGTGPYTPDQLHNINAASAEKILERWEKMTQAELAKRRDGLRGNIQDRVEGTAPVSSDPYVRQLQLITHAELTARLDALKEAAGHSTSAFDNLKEWFNGLGQIAEEGQILRDLRGTQNRNNGILRKQFDLMDKLMNSLPVPEQDRFYDRMMRGEAQDQNITQSMDSELLREWQQKNGQPLDVQEIADRVRAALDAARDRVTATTGDLSDFIVNYMPGLYDNVGRAAKFADQWAQRRPLAGGSDFLKQKFYEFHQDAVNAGLQPATANPVRAALMRIEQLNRFVMGHEFKNQLINRQLADWFGPDEVPPEGWHKLNDKMFGEQGGFGSYWAPERVAKNFNNFVSVGLTGKWRLPYVGWSLYDAARNINSTMNMAQLGWSVFHGVEMGLNSMFTAFSVGMKQVKNGQVGTGLGNILKAHTLIGPIIEDTWKGHFGQTAFTDPVSNLNYAQLANDLEKANANVHTTPMFQLHQVDRFKRNWTNAADEFLPKSTRVGAVLKAGINVMGAATEAAGAPLMNGLVPRVKVGAFARMAEEIHYRMAGQPPDAIQAELQKAWDSVDNRFGEVNYDNWFMNRTAKDTLMLLTRSLGWTGGTVREVGGGALDLGKSVVDAAQGKGFNVTHRTAYTAALIMGTMEINAVYQYLHTGQMAHGIDFFFPKDGSKSSTGEDNRMYPKDYVYDFINMYHDPMGTTFHKAAPWISTLSDLVHNEDYYHREIHDPGNSPVQNASSTIGFLARQFVPFSVGNVMEGKLRGQGKSAFEGMGAILPAPRWVGRTSAENLAFTYFNGTQSQGGLDPVTLERKQNFLQLRNKVANGEVTDQQVTDAVNSGKLQPKMVQYLYQTRTQPMLNVWTQRLESPSQVWNIWKAASDPEKQKLLPVVLVKMANLTSGEEQEHYLKEVENWYNQHKK